MKKGKVKTRQTPHTTRHPPLLIGIDGNEANSVRPDIKARVGSNQYAYGILKSLYEVDRKNDYLVYLEAPPLEDLPRERKNWHYRVTGPAKFWTQWRLPLELYLKKPKPSVFFTPGHYAPRFSPIPRVVTIMDLGFYRFPEQFRKKDLWQLKSWTEYSVRKAAHILAISQSTKKDIVRHYGIDPKKITVTYPGYDEEKFQFPVSSFQINKVKKKYRIKGDYLLFLSVLKPSKNVEGLLEAFKILTTRHSSPITLVIAGSKGWLYEDIFKKVKALKLAKKVIFTGFVPEEEVPPLMGGAEAYVLPSFWEGFGIPVVEAMATGTPVVVSNAGSLPEVAGEAGILVDPESPESIAEGINKVVSASESQYNKLAEKGLAQARKFSWEKTAKKTLAVLEEVA